MIMLNALIAYGSQFVYVSLYVCMFVTLISQNKAWRDRKCEMVKKKKVKKGESMK